MRDEQETGLVRKSITDLLYIEAKAMREGNFSSMRFQGQGGGGIIPMYSSMESWDAALDTRFAGSKGRSNIDYMNKIGDLANNSLIVAAIKWLGNCLQEAPLVVKENQEGGKGESKQVDNHKLVKLWNRPNKFYSGSTLKKAIAMSWILKSEAYILKFYNKAGNEPMELWWEPHWTIRPIWPIDGSEFISGYEIQRNGAWEGPIPVKNVIHLRDGLSPYNQRIGFSGLSSILPELYGDGEAAQYYATLLSGSGTPPFMVALDANMRLDQQGIEKFRRELLEKTKGSKRGEPIVAKGAKAYKLGFNPTELNLSESRYMAEDRFCAVLGVPSNVLELGSANQRSTYNNVGQAMERAWDSYITPMLKHIAEELTVQLLPNFEKNEDSNRYCEHDLSKVQALQEDEDNKATRLSGLWSAGAIMRSEIRSALGYGPSDPQNEDADKVFLIQTATEAAAAQAAMAPPEDPNAVPGGEPPPADDGGFWGDNFDTEEPLPEEAVAKSLTITGDDTGLEWKDFKEGLSIPRTAMPQVKSSHRGAMVQFLKGRKISSTKEDVLPGTLKPSQKEYAQSKVEKAKEWIGPTRPLLVSKDDYVLDGHHQWMAALDNPDTPIPIIRLDGEAYPLLLEMSRFPSSGVAAMKSKNGHAEVNEAIMARIEKASLIHL